MCRTTQRKSGVRTVSGRVTALIGGGLLLAAGLVDAVGALPAAGQLDPHHETVTALQDVKAAIVELRKVSDDSSLSGAEPYRKAAHRAINDLVGNADPRYDAKSGRSADPGGALVHLGHVLHDSSSQPWVQSVTGANVNVQAAVGGLQNALEDDELQDFLLDESEALAHLDVAIGRSSGSGAFGGLRGALANTELGIPPHARVISGCSEPSVVPAYGVKDGYVIYVAVPVSGGKAQLPENFSSNKLVVNNKRLVAYTAAAQLRGQLCSGVDASASPRYQKPIQLAAAAGFIRVANAPDGHSQSTSVDPIRIAKVSDTNKANASKSAGASAGGDSGLPALYTTQQAKAGKRVFNNKCVACHGEHLQGKSAPSVAGKDFLEVANRNGWTLQDLRNVVVYNMPFSNPGSLSKHQYADVLAFLLASNCYPAGSKPFPESGSDALSKFNVESPDKIHPSNKKTGVCSVN